MKPEYKKRSKDNFTFREMAKCFVAKCVLQRKGAIVKLLDS